ncbi:solute carrier organic anion transporter family member 1B3-like [Rhynchocyon petersi]
MANEKRSQDIFDSEMNSNHPLKLRVEEQPSDKRKSRCCNGFKVFFMALSFSFIAKSLSGIIMKSSVTHIERRFDVSSSVAGLIDGSFEIGNLFFIVFVSHFGSKLHRPKLIGIGCIIMGMGSILTALPHFFMGYYRYSKESSVNLPSNTTSSLSTCLNNQFNRTSSEIVEHGCVKEYGSNMWIYVLMGNMLRGIGETPIAPLGISYIDDFAKEGHSSFYVGSLNAIGMVGLVIGFLLASVSGKLYVDIGYVDLGSVRITPMDSRWVGAWWLGFLVAGAFSLTSSIPFFFIPKSLNKPEKGRTASISSNAPETKKEMKLSDKSMNSEKNCSENLTGVISIPTFAFGLFTGGYIIKKCKLNLMGIAKLSFFFLLLAFIFQSLYLLLFCETKSVAGLTLTYDGKSPVTSHINVPLSSCNIDCNCDKKQWEPVCGENGIIYVSPCLAGCMTSGSNPESKVFYNCSCVDIAGFQNGSNSAHLGECPRSDSCIKKFYLYLGVQILGCLAISLGGTPAMMLVFKNVKPELKSLAVGFHSLTIRSLGGILAPIYFGAVIDKACLKWSITNCGTQGSCRLYNSKLFGYYFFGLLLSCNVGGIILYCVFLYAMKKKYQGKDAKTENGIKVIVSNYSSMASEKHPQDICDPDMDQNHTLNSAAEEQPPIKKRSRCCNGFKVE